MIPHPRYNITSICDKFLKSAIYASKIYGMIKCGTTHESIITTRLRIFQKNFQFIEEFEDSEKAPNIRRILVTVKAIYLAPSYLRESIGSIKVPLSYIICDSITPATIDHHVQDSTIGASYESILE